MDIRFLQWYWNRSRLSLSFNPISVRRPYAQRSVIVNTSVFTKLPGLGDKEGPFGLRVKLPLVNYTW